MFPQGNQGSRSNGIYQISERGRSSGESWINPREGPGTEKCSLPTGQRGLFLTGESAGGWVGHGQPSPALPSDVLQALQAAHSAAATGHWQELPLSPPRSGFSAKHKICSTYMVNCEQRKQLTHPSQHHMAGCKK